MSTMDPGLLRAALSRPRDTLAALDKIEAEGSLLSFVKQGWHALEPGAVFQHGWAIEAVAAHLEAVSNGVIKRLLINIPPGCTKSMLVNVFWPAWEWGPRRMPHLRYISASYEQGLATRDMVRCRDLLTSEWYKKRWPIEFKEDQDQKTLYANTFTGWRFASSVGGKLVGYRGDRINIDDPHDIESAESDKERHRARRWLTTTIPTRLNKQKESAIVLIMQRLHVQDLSGLIIADQGDDWVHLCLPMEFEEKTRCWTRVPRPGENPTLMRRVLPRGETIPHYVPDPNGVPMWCWDPRTAEGELLWEERFDREAVDALKRSFRSGDGGSYAEAGQLQQRPVHRAGGMFKREAFRPIETLPTGIKWVRGWDLAASTSSTSPYTAGVKLGMKNGALYIGDVVRFRDESEQVEEKIKAIAQQDGRACPLSIPQDPGQAGKAQRNSYAKMLHGHEAHFSPESGDKEGRARPIASQVAAGNVYVPAGAPWLPEFLAEAGLFPGSDYKDQIDALSRAYAWHLANRGDDIAMVPSKVY